MPCAATSSSFWKAGRSAPRKTRAGSWSPSSSNATRPSAATCAGLLLLMLVVWFSFKINYQARVRREQSYASFVKEQEDKRQRGKKSAPLFVRDARLSAEKRNLDYALDQVNVALDYDADLAEALLVKGQIYIVRKDFAAARRELEQYLQRRPDDKDAARLLELARGRPGDSSVAAALVDVFVRQGVFGLAEQMETNKGHLFGLYQKRINAAWPGNLGNRLTLAEGKCQLDLNFCPQVKDLSPLEGMPLDRLLINQSGGVWDLRPLAGMPLTHLELHGCGQVRDLTPLHGMPLTRLNLTSCREVRDLTPLKGMPLTWLSLRDCAACERPGALRGIKLTYLDLSACRQVSDLGPLQGMPLSGLSLWDCHGVRDLTPLRGLPLTWLNLVSCSGLRNLEGLARPETDGAQYRLQCAAHRSDPAQGHAVDFPGNGRRPGNPRSVTARRIAPDTIGYQRLQPGAT